MGFPSALGGKKGQKRAVKSPKMPQKAPKSQETNSHVEVVKNISNVVANNS